jgi:hypothetical protein
VCAAALPATSVDKKEGDQNFSAVYRGEAKIALSDTIT